MKKLTALLLVVVLCAMALASCGPTVMTHEQFVAAEAGETVTIETYVQAKQGWWNNKIVLYTQDENGGYFIYDMACSEEDAAKLVPGTKIRVTGPKAIYSGLHEIYSSVSPEDITFEIIEGNYVATATDVTAKLADKDELFKYQNMLAAFKGMTVVASTDKDGNEKPFLYNWDGSGAEGSDSDLYFNASVNGKTYNFVIEYYLTGANSDAYKAVQALEIGDVIDIEGFLYYYDSNPQPHVVNVTVQE